jgi:hypothetical protein
MKSLRFLVAVLLGSATVSQAASSVVPGSETAHAANFGWINGLWDPATPAGLVVTDHFMAGHAYAANVGWVDFGDGAPTGTSGQYRQTAGDIGVNHDGSGGLAGYAYGANIGWIFFDPSIAEPPRIDLASGTFSGYAYSANCGWVNLASLQTVIAELVAPLAQVITFPKPPAKFYLSEGPIHLYASASSGLPILLEVVSGPARVAGEALVITGTGKVVVRASQPGNVDYRAAQPITHTFTVVTDPVRAMLTQLQHVYDGTPKSASVVGHAQEPILTYVVNREESSNPPVNAGSYTVKAAVDGRTLSGKLVILPAPLTVTALHQRRFVGEENPPLGLVFEGFANGDDEATVFAAEKARRPVAVTPAKKSSPGGVYPITATGGALANYRLVPIQGRLTVETFAGRYEALLVDAEERPAAKVELVVAASSTVFTGKLTVSGELSPLPFKGTLTIDSQAEQASGRTDPILKGENVYSVGFTLPFEADFAAELSANAEDIANSDSGKKLYTPTAADQVPVGTHTLVLASAVPADAGTPLGAGHAVAVLDAKGVLKLTGRLGDATPFTTALAADPQAGFRCFTLPYKRLDSHLAGWLGLQDHPGLTGRMWIPAGADTQLWWQKAAGEKDASYRDGFGPVTCLVTLDPWVKPGKNRSLADLLELPDTGDFAVALQGVESDSMLDLPTQLQMDASNQWKVASETNPTSWNAKVNPANGLISGGFTLMDTVPGVARPVQRRVSFTGVARQPHGAVIEELGAGQFLVPALPGEGAAVAGAVRFERPLER